MTEINMLKPAKTNPKKVKTFTINALLQDPVDGSKKCIVDDIDAVIKKEINIKHFAWIIHDKVQRNDAMPAHILLLLTLNESRSAAYIAKLFGVDVKCVKEGLHCGTEVFQRFSPIILLYLLNVNDPEKYQYSIEELHADTKTLSAYPKYLQSLNQKYGEPSGKTSPKNPLAMMMEQIKEGRRLSDIREDSDLDYTTFLKFTNLLKQAENESIFHDAVLPSILLNIYIYGEPETDKTTLAKILAKWLYKTENHPYFTVATQDEPFQDYAQEKAILWKDAKSDILRKTAPNGEVLEMLDPFQKEKTARMIKKSHVILTNELNIFTSNISYREFFKNITPIDISDKQVYRRFPILIKVKSDEISVFMNKAYYIGLIGSFSYDEKAEWFEQTCKHDMSIETTDVTANQNDKNIDIVPFSDDIEEEIAALMLLYDNYAYEYIDICRYKVDIKRIMSVASEKLTIRILEPFLMMLEYVVEKLRVYMIKDEDERSV